jgi:hypothetical protein
LFSPFPGSNTGCSSFIVGRSKKTATVQARPSMVRLKPPTVTSTLHTIDGRLVCSRSDGTFDLELEDAKPLLAAGWQQIPKAT